MNTTEIDSALALLGQQGFAIPGIQLVPLYLFVIVLSGMLGVGAVFVAFTPIREESFRIAWACIVLSLGSALASLFLLGSHLAPLAYMILAAPSILGFITLALNRLYPPEQSFRGGQFPLAALFLVVTAVVVLIGIIFIITGIFTAN